MDSAGSSNTIVKKQEDDDKNDKRDIKPVPKTLNRVPRKLLKYLSLDLSFCSVHQIKGACVSYMTLFATFSILRFIHITRMPAENKR
jgi:hypothetical protein